METSSRKLLFFIIILTACLTMVAADIYSPSIPDIAMSFQSSFSLVKWTMVSYIAGVALSQLFFGPLSEGLGRRKPIIIGLSIMLFGSFLAWLATDIQFLILARFIQGIGAGSCAGLWRSIIRDVLSGAELAKVGSYFVIAITFIVPAAPALGGYLQEYFGWQANFVFMMFYALVALLVFIYGFKETSVHHSRDKLQLPFVKNTFGILLKSPIFMGASACTFLAYGSLFSCITILPILLIHHLGMDPISFGWLTFIGTGIAYGLSGVTNSKLVSRLGVANMMRLGFFIMITAGLMLLCASLFLEMAVWNVALPIFIFYFGSTLIWPSAFSLAFTPYGHIAGYAGALYGFMQICGGAVITGLISLLSDRNQMPLGLIIVSTTVIAWFILEKISQPAPVEVTA